MSYVGSGPGNSGSESGVTVSSGVDDYIGYDYGTGFASGDTIDSGGFQYVGDDFGVGSATSTEIDGDGNQYVGYSGGTGTAQTTTVGNGGAQYVGDAGFGTASGTTIGDRGVQIVGESGGTGTATDTTIEYGGTQSVGDFDSAGAATGTTIDDGGFQYVGLREGAGTTTGTTLDGGGYQYLGYQSGASGSASNTTVSGRQEVGYDGGTGTATDTTIASGGIQYLGDGGMSTGTAIGTTIDSGGNQLVGVGGAGMATSTTIDSGGSQNVGEDTKSATASATATTISGGIQVVGDFGTGTATDTTIDSGGVQYVGSQGTGTATDTTIDSGGAQYVGIAEGEGTATTTTIYGGGIQYVGYNPFAMGTATDTTIDSGGTQYVGDDGTGTASGTTISGGEQVVSSGGTATDTTIYSGGAADVLSGGVVDTPVIDGGTIELAKGASVGGRIDFAADSGADGGALDLTGEGSGLTFTPLISGFTGTGDTAALSDILKVTGSAATDQVFWTQSGASGTLDVETQAGGMLASMKLDGTYDQNQFALNYAAGVDQITYAACYVRGTRVLTDRGDVAVEALRVGEFVVTASGGRRPIVWIGHRGLDLARHPDPLAVKPVRVRAGAFGEGSPRRDLWLSPGHNVAFAGALMPISALINAASVAQMDWDRVEYWHVELDAHDILLAEGLPAESYLDTGNRTAFANGGAFVEAHPDFRPKHWAQTCLPLRKEGAEVVAARARLRARLEQRGYAVTAEADPHILVDGVRINPSRLSPTCLAFDLPPGRASIFLCSRAFIPATVFPGSEDLRALGLSVARLQIDRDEVDLGQDDAPGAGWHAPEREGVFFTRRWTNGSAALPPGARFVMVDLASEGLYWREPEGAAAARESVARGEARGCRA